MVARIALLHAQAVTFRALRVVAGWLIALTGLAVLGSELIDHLAAAEGRSPPPFPEVRWRQPQPLWVPCRCS